MPFTRRTAVVSVAAIAAALLAPFGPASAADPHGTVVLASGKSAFPDYVSVLGTVDGGVVTGDYNSGLYDVPTSGGHVSQVTTSIDYVSSAGDYVWVSKGTHTGWINVTDHTDTGTVPSKWQVAYPDGGIYLTGSSPSKLIEQTYAQIGTTDYAATIDMPSYVQQYDSLLVGPDGVAVVSMDPDTGDVLVNYVAFGSTTVTPVPTTGSSALSCYSVSSNGVGCQQGNHVVRLSLTGGQPVVTSARHISTVAVTDANTAWTTYDGTFHSVPAAGGTVSTAAAKQYYDTVVADGAHFYTALSGSLGVAGLYSFTDAASAPTSLYTSPAQPLAASGVALSAGRVGWQDDSKKSYPVWTRSLTTNGGSITAGSSELVGTTGASSDSAPSLSGVRTAWASLLTSTGTGFSINVSDGTTTTTLPDKAQYPATLSGLRVLYQKHGGATQDDQFVYDLTDGTKKDLTSADGAEFAALSGDHVAEVTKHGAVLWRSLSGGKTQTVRQPLASGDKFQYANVYASGDWVAWSIEYTHGTHDRTTSGYRDARTMAKTHDVSDYPSAATSDGLVVEQSYQKYFLLPWNGSAKITLPKSSSTPDVYGSLMSWTDPNGEPKVAPLPRHFANRPRSLGDPEAAASIGRGKAWRFDLVTTAPLSSCSVKITSAGKLVHTINCSAKAMKAGEIVGSWDTGKGGLAKGSYRWTVVAKNADGSLLNADGSTAATTGTVKLT